MQLIVFPPRPSQHFNIFPPSNLANVPNHYFERCQQGERRGVSRREVSNKFLYFFIPLIFNCLVLPPFTFFFHLNRFTARDDFGGDWIGESLGGRGGGDVKIHGEQVG